MPYRSQLGFPAKEDICIAANQSGITTHLRIRLVGALRQLSALSPHVVPVINDFRALLLHQANIYTHVVH